MKVASFFFDRHDLIYTKGQSRQKEFERLRQKSSYKQSITFLQSFNESPRKYLIVPSLSPLSLERTRNLLARHFIENVNANKTAT
jgi:hypothetical protein